MGIKDFKIALSDSITKFIGSWTFVIIQSVILITWIVINSSAIVSFDPYPFILLNLFLSFEAAYATPLILMSSNRSATRDRRYLVQVLEANKDITSHINDVFEQVETITKELQEIKRLVRSLKN